MIFCTTGQAEKIRFSRSPSEASRAYSVATAADASAASATSQKPNFCAAAASFSMVTLGGKNAMQAGSTDKITFRPTLINSFTCST